MMRDQAPPPSFVSKKDVMTLARERDRMEAPSSEVPAHNPLRTQHRATLRLCSLLASDTDMSSVFSPAARCVAGAEGRARTTAD